MGELAAVEQRLRLALTRAPKSARLHDELGIALARQQRYPEALRMFERALQLDPTLPHTRRRLGDALSACGRGAEADRLYASTWLRIRTDRRWPTLPSTCAPAGRSGDRAARGRATPQSRSDRRPQHAGAGASGRPVTADDIEALLRRVTELAPDYVVAWNDLGGLHLKCRKWLKAAEAFRTAARLDPRSAAAWAGLARRAGAGGLSGPRRRGL